MSHDQIKENNKLKKINNDKIIKKQMNTFNEWNKKYGRKLLGELLTCMLIILQRNNALKRNKYRF